MRQPLTERLHDLQYYRELIDRKIADTRELISDGEDDVALTNDDRMLAQAMTGDTVVTAYMVIFLLTYCDIAEKNIEQFEGHFMCPPNTVTYMIDAIRKRLQ